MGAMFTYPRVRDQRILDIVLSPRGAELGSPGREPRVPISQRSTEPRRGDTSTRDTCRPAGAQGVFVVSEVPGLTPRVTQFRPSGAKKEHFGDAKQARKHGTREPPADDPVVLAADWHCLFSDLAAKCRLQGPGFLSGSLIPA
jgi:hypothetical protein